MCFSFISSLDHHLEGKTCVFFSTIIGPPPSTAPVRQFLLTGAQKTGVLSPLPTDHSHFKRGSKGLDSKAYSYV